MNFHIIILVCLMTMSTAVLANDKFKDSFIVMATSVPEQRSDSIVAEENILGKRLPGLAWTVNSLAMFAVVGVVASLSALWKLLGFAYTSSVARM
jgi:hypothetical protein